MAAAPPTTRASTASISSALRAVRETRGGKLGFNAKFIIETGEEIGSPDLRQVCEGLREELKADLFLASDGPRLSADRPTIFLGCRGGIRIHLDVNLRDGGHHSGNWGGVLANAATILSSAIAALVDGKGPDAARRAQAAAHFEPDPRRAGGREGRTTSRRAAAVAGLGRGGPVAGRAAVCLEHAGSAGDVVGQYREPRQRDSRRGANAVLQLRFVVGTKYERSSMPCATHLHGKALRWSRSAARKRFAASRTDFDSPWVELDRGIDPPDHRQGARDPAEFRRLAAQRRVRRRAGAADDLGAAFLSRLLAARAERAHPAAGDGGGARDHGGPVLGPRREEEGA